MRVGASIAALLVSFPSVTVIIAEATNSTSSGSTTIAADLAECFGEISCTDTSCSECFAEIITFDTEPSESLDHSEYVECVQSLPTIESMTFGLCYTYRTLACCASELYDGGCSEFFPPLYACYLDYYECPSEYYSCTEGAVEEGSASSDDTFGEGSGSSDSAFGEGSASSNATVTTRNGQLSRLVSAIALIFTITFAMGV